MIRIWLWLVSALFVVCLGCTTEQQPAQIASTQVYPLAEQATMPWNQVELEAYSIYRTAQSDREMLTLTSAVHYLEKPSLELIEVMINDARPNPRDTLSFYITLKCLQPIKKDAWFNYHIYRVTDGNHLIKGAYYLDEGAAPSTADWEVGKTYTLGPIDVELNPVSAYGVYTMAGTLAYPRDENEEFSHDLLTYSNPDVKYMMIAYFQMPDFEGLIHSIQTSMQTYHAIRSQIKKNGFSIWEEELNQLERKLDDQLPDFLAAAQRTQQDPNIPFPYKDSYIDILRMIQENIEAYNRACMFQGSCPAALMDQPRTLYKPEHITYAKHHIQHYSWATEILNEWKERTQFLMDQPPGFVESFIEQLTPWSSYGQVCPHCIHKQCAEGESNVLQWDVHHPDQLTCKYCGTTYPNPDYPETGILDAPKMGQTFHYYETKEERAHPEDKSGKYAYQWAHWPIHVSFSGLIRYHKIRYCSDRVLPLAQLYILTGNTAYAEKAIEILEVLAHRFPNWLYHSYDGTYADCPPYEAALAMAKHPPAGRFDKDVIRNAFEGMHHFEGYAALNNGFWGAGRFVPSGTDASAVHPMVVAYDLIRRATDDSGKPILKPTVEKQILEGLFIPATLDTEQYHAVNNKIGRSLTLSAAMGMLFENPRRVRRALEGFEALLDHSFYFDGFCKESPSYSNMHLSLMSPIPEILMGYTDPTYLLPSDSKGYQQLNPFKQTTRYQLALEGMVRMLDPNLQFPTIGDTHYQTTLQPKYVEILTSYYDPAYATLLAAVQGDSLVEKGDDFALWRRDPAVMKMNTMNEHHADTWKQQLPFHSEWFPGWHVGVLRGSQPDGKTALYFNGNAMDVHRHHDTLSIIHYAYGQEFASDRGYMWDDPRNAWMKATLSHNIVVVDFKNQDRMPHTSKLDVMGIHDRVQFIQASGDTYLDCDRYTRALALVPLTETEHYVVDWFLVHGGTEHHYAFQSNGTFDSKEIPFQPTEKEHPWLSNFRSSIVQPGWSVGWVLNDMHYDLTMLSPIDRLLVADAPGWRSREGNALDASPIQQIFAENTIKDTPLQSLYVAILEPYKQDANHIVKAKLLVYDAEAGISIVQVELSDRVDTLYWTSTGGLVQSEDNTLKGTFGFHSQLKDSEKQTAYLLHGQSFTHGRIQLELPEQMTMYSVVSQAGRSYTVKETIAHPETLQGQTLLVNDTGYEIESASANSITVRAYPAIPAEKVELCLGIASP
jgi:hypothetical protein